MYNMSKGGNTHMAEQFFWPNPQTDHYRHARAIGPRSGQKTNENQIPAYRRTPRSGKMPKMNRIEGGGECNWKQYSSDEDKIHIAGLYVSRRAKNTQNPGLVSGFFFFKKPNLILLIRSQIQLIFLSLDQPPLLAHARQIFYF